ncbi:Cubilin like, partial [Pseudolycoriella hygida]
WPNEYPTNKVCTWTLVAPTGQQIELLINSFELEERENCVFDYLELKNGGTLQSPLLGKYCGTTIPKIIRSYTNQLRIEFKSDSSRNFKGFDITWDSTISGCGGHINKLMRGSIHSPNYPNPYGINSQCDWRITVSKGSLVQLLFSDLEFEEHSDCYFDYIEIFDGRSSAAKSFGKYCSLAAVPSQILSTTNEVFVRMISDVNNQGRGFDLRFNSICTQEIHLHRGVIESPNFPNHYPDNLQCEWMVVAPVGNQIFVAFSQFEVEESTMEHVQTSDDCSFDYLEIIQKKSGDKEFEQKQTYCKTMPKEFTSIGDVVVFKFQTDSSFASSGFHLEFEVQGCGDIFTHPTGNFTSPNYPNVYPHGVTCEWSIVALYGYVIELTINDLDIETTHECIDKLEVSSEKNFSHPLSTFCHNFNKPVIMTSHGNELFVKLSTDFSFNGKGFSAFYTTKPIQCGGMFKVRSLSFTSPHYPQNYDHNLYCEWFLQVEENHRLSLSFDDFDVEEGCEHDSVKIYDGFDKTDNSLMETLCGNERTRKIYNSTDNKMLVVMQTDESMVSKGFSAKFKTACGKSIMINESGTIEMNSFYDIDSSNCNWTLIAPKSEPSGEQDGNDFAVDEEDCDEVAEESSDDECDAGLSDEEQDSDEEGGNKLLAFIAICYTRGTLELKNMSVASIFSRRHGSSFIRVSISKENFKNIMKFLRFNDKETQKQRLASDKFALMSEVWISFIENCKKCCNPGEKITGGRIAFSNKETAELKNPNLPFNESNIYLDQNGTTLILYQSKHIKSVSILSSLHKSVKITDSAKKKPETMHYYNKTKCGVDVAEQMAKKQHVTVTISSLDVLIYDGTICNVKILIFDGLNAEAPLIREICVEGHPPPIMSNGNALTLSIVSQFASTNFKFIASYSTLDNTCGGKFSDLSGQVASPSYPKSYPNNVECVWELSASLGNRLILTVEKMDIEFSENCHEDYLEIRENDVSGKLIGVYCGKDVPSVFPQAERFWLKFRSSSDGVGGGFLAEYAYAKTIEIDGSSGTITSPLYPHVFSQYGNSFFYRITVRHGYYISIVSKELLLRSDGGIRIYDGYDENAPVEELPKSDSEKFVSSSNVVVITIGVDYLTVLSLKLEWNEVSEKRQKTINETQTTNCTENSIVYVSDGQNINITSPGFPYGYATNLNCTWILKPEEVGRHAVFLFDEIDLEDTVNCLGDYVKIYSSNDLSNYKLLNTTCQVTPNEILQLYGDPYLKVNFVSDYYTNRTGFSGIAKSACGSPMNGPSGIIKATTKDTNCEWSITVRRGRTIKFEFLNLAVPDAANGDCRSYVLLKNGESMESPFLGQGKFCGTTIPTVENTFSNRAYVAFKKHSLQTSMASFTLRYEEATYNCGGSIIFNGENSTIIHTPNYPNAPHPHIECVWTVIVPSGELIQVNFIERFDIKNSKSCEEEYVELRDGGTVNGNLIGQFCGQMPPTQYSSSNVLRIKYYTDTTMPMNGFKANISLAKCGGYYRYRSGVIQSSHYPGLGAYEKNSICEYHLIGRDGSSMNLTFIDLNLPSSDDCSTTDHLEIYSVLNSEEESSEPTKDEIGKYCGSGRLPPSILTSSNVLVRFVTMNGNNLYRGFRISFSFSMEKCGGEVTADTGFITSPGYPIGRPFRQYCEWRVTVPKGRRVKAEIVDFDLGFIPLTGSGRYYARVSFQQSLTFYNDFKYSSRIKKIGLNDTTEPVYSSDNKMLISLWIKNNAGHRGFKLEFSSDEPSICSGNFNSDEGTIESPKNVSTYYCEYGRDPSAPLVAEETNAGTLAIYIAESSVISSSVCLVISPIIVEYLPSQRQRVFTQKCNASSEFPPIASPFQQTKVITKKGGYYSQVSPYTISYKVNKCGKLIRDTQEVVIRNPQFPPNYGRVACAWQYSTISGNYGNLNCTNEYVYITASPFPSYMKKERFCGPSSLILSNYTIPRSAKSVFIEYHSANYNPNSTFDITIKANYSVCGGTLLAPIFEFSNPTNGSQYPNNIECIWDITTSIGYHIGVSFVNRFFLEDSVNCTKDYIELLDFIDNDWKILGRICGRSAPKQFNSTGTRMRLIFRTNENIAGEGFTVKWEENCGGVFSVTKESQTLTSPRYPNKYPRNLKCNYTLVAGKEDFINIDFDEFELEDTSRSCVYDNLTIYKYEEWSYPPNTPMLVGSYCWRGSLTHVRHKHKINLIFSSDPFVEGRGFSSRYYLDNCGGNVTNSSMIEVPRKESGKYADYLTCLWYVKAPANNKIVIRFEYFELEHNDHCYLDAVEVFQGLKTDADQRKAMLCGNLTQHAPVVNIKSNNAIVKFHSDGNVNNGGFSALILFSENCDKTIELNDKSPSYTLNQTSTSYPPHLDCHYVITVPDGYVVKIEFEHFHLAPCHNDTSCTCDYVAILDGSDTFAEAIDKNLCGHSLPQSVTSSGRSLFVRYVTDSVYSSSGFSANLKMEPVACGKTLIQLNSTNGEHTLKWPIDSSSYQPNSQCDWIIEVADMEHVEIHFEKFELEDADSSGQCSKDVLKLTDEDTNLYNSEGLGSQFIFTGGKSKVMQPFFYWGRSFPTAPHDYCGSGIPNDFVSNSKRVRVRFRSNESIQKSGFQFIARMSPVCHRNYTSLQGRIFVKILRDCETYITVPENNTISLYFGVFNVYLSDYSFQCTNETAPVRIYDNRQNRLLQYVCPGSLPNPIFANTSSLMIKTKRMETSWMDNNGAYDLIYLASDKGLGCGGQIFNYAGQFSSPMYPANDRNASDCRWDIAVPQNLVIAISFVVFDMGSSIHCSDNYFQIIETDYEGKETVARQYCGEDVPSAYKSNRNVLSIRFKKTSNFAGTGWNIQFMAVHQSAVAGSY